MSELSATDWKRVVTVGLLIGVFNGTALHFLPHGLWRNLMYAVASAIPAGVIAYSIFPLQAKLSADYKPHQ
jgi:hypothetical protein